MTQNETMSAQMMAQMVESGDMTPGRVMAAMLLKQEEVTETLKKHEDAIDYLANNQPIHPSTLRALDNKRKAIVVGLLGGKDAPAYQDKKLARTVFRKIAMDFHEHFNINSYAFLAKKDEKAAFDYLSVWKPDTNTQLLIDNANKASLMTVV